MENSVENVENHHFAPLCTTVTILYPLLQKKSTHLCEFVALFWAYKNWYFSSQHTLQNHNIFDTIFHKSHRRPKPIFTLSYKERTADHTIEQSFYTEKTELCTLSDRGNLKLGGHIVRHAAPHLAAAPAVARHGRITLHRQRTARQNS